MSTSCSCSDPLLDHLDSLPPHDLVIWTIGSVAFFWQRGFDVLAIWPHSGTETTFSYLERPVQKKAYLLQPAPFCQLFSGLSSTNKTATSLTFALSLLHFPLFRPPFYPTLSSTSGRNSLPPGYNGSPDTHFFWGMTQLTSWQGKVHSSSYLLSHTVSFFWPLIFTLLFSRTGRVLFGQILWHTSPLSIHWKTCASWCPLCPLLSLLQQTELSV